ncbi:unnamed protein product [Paramecium primaurelia]|uniref:Pre-mRNA-splicing factor CWC26 n=1 Tax=Paramecium primaurelia TaxID=5886 RepID=A0A8S1JTD9_PARPR|nr:unnamed protein product [Paramecium primaurelia]
MDKLSYLKKYMDNGQSKTKVTYQNNIKDQDNIDVLMGRVISKENYNELEQQPIFVETPESILIDKQKKQLFLKQMMNKERSRSNSQGSNSSDSDSDSESDDSSSKSDSDMSVERAPKPQEVIHRDVNTGQRITQSQRVEQEKQLNPRLKAKEDKQAILQANKQQIEMWSKGLVQIQEKQKKQEDAQQALVTKNEEQIKQIDMQLMGQQKFDDPMRKMIQEEDDKQITLKQSDFLLKCKFPPPINRFNILPGFRWDGVDRSNGYEMKLLNSINDNKYKKLEKQLENMRDQ